MRKMFFMAVSATIILAAAVFCIAQSGNKVLSAFQVPTEAQADTPPSEEEETIDEHGGSNGGQWIKGYAMLRVYYTSGFEWSLTPFSFWVTYSTAFCCVKHNECTACLKSQEQNVCKYLSGL